MKIFVLRSFRSLSLIGLIRVFRSTKPNSGIRALALPLIDFLKGYNLCNKVHVPRIGLISRFAAQVQNRLEMRFSWFGFTD